MESDLSLYSLLSLDSLYITLNLITPQRHTMGTKANNNDAMHISSVISPDLISEGFDRNITARSRGGIMRLLTAARYSFEKNVVTRRTSVPWTVNIHASSSTHFLCRFWLFDIALPRRFANSCPSSESLGASACPSWWTRPRLVFS